MMLTVNDRIALTEFREADKPALVEVLNDRNIYHRTLRIPFPYTADDADRWLALVAENTRQQGRPHTWAIRGTDGVLLGGAGFQDIATGGHRAEIGYWLATLYWGQGIMTEVVRRLCRHAFEDLGLLKITAHVFAHNPASARVLEKCSFVQEGLLRQHFRKDGELIDALAYGLLRE